MLDGWSFQEGAKCFKERRLKVRYTIYIYAWAHSLFFILTYDFIYCWLKYKSSAYVFTYTIANLHLVQYHTFGEAQAGLWAAESWNVIFIWKGYAG